MLEPIQEYQFSFIQEQSMFEGHTPIRKGIKFIRLSGRPELTFKYFRVMLKDNVLFFRITNNRASENELLSELDNKISQYLEAA